MSNKKEFVKDIANIDENFAQWYTDIVLKADKMVVWGRQY